MKRHFEYLLLLSFGLSTTHSVYALSLDQSSKVSVTIGSGLSVDVYADSKKPKNYYYLPSRVRVAAGSDGRPNITILTYISDESMDKAGGTFNALVTWGLTEVEENQVAQKLRGIKSGARLMGAAPVEPVESGPSVNVIAALGGEEKIVWSGTAPLQHGGRAAIAANLTPQGATNLDAGIQRGNMAGITVEMSFLVPFKADMGRCTVEINWNAFSREFEDILYTHRKGGQGAFQDSWKYVDENHYLVSIADQAGYVSNDCDYDRANRQQMEFFENAIQTYIASILGASEEARAASDKVQSDIRNSGDDGGPSDEDLDGGDWDRYEYDYMRQVVAQMTGTDRFEISRSFVVRDPVFALGNVKEWIEGNENSPGVRIGSVDLSSTEFAQVPVSFTLGNTAIEMFGSDDTKAALNTVSVNIRKKRGQGSEYRDFHVFTKSDVNEGKISHQFQYARGNANEPFQYDYSVDWSFVGQRPVEGRFESSTRGAHTLMPGVSSATVLFNGNAYGLSENNILGVTAEIKYRFLGKERVTYMNVFADDESRQQATIFLDEEARTFAYRTVFTHAEHGELATEWAIKTAPVNGPVAIHALIPDELATGDTAFISKATTAVRGEANRQLDDVLSEFDQL